MFHGALSMAQKTLHIAVFSLTDNKTANVLIDAKERGVDVKIVTDNDQLEGKGADVRRLHEEFGIPFKTDNR
jgi:phosphatidylserine/phosphatidylglycerophosphate/cardiolipin synthase-like enzyme